MRNLFCLLTATIVGTSAARSQPSSVTLAIENVTVLPMKRDTALVGHTVLISGDRIMWVGPSRAARIPSGARRIDGSGGFLMPGLVDMHVHLDRRELLSGLLGAGITTVRNMRGAPIHLAWRDSIARGLLAGPSIITAGPSLRGRPGQGFASVPYPDAGEAAVRSQAKAGYDMIKVLYGISPETYQLVTRIARELRIPVVGHVMPDVGLGRSLAAGQVSFEHADGLVERPLSTRVAERLGVAIPRRDTNAYPGLAEAARDIARAGAWVGTILSSRDGQCLAPSAATRQIVATMRREKVRLLAGSDVGLGRNDGASGVHCELRTLVAAGLTPYEVLVTATFNPGEFARMHLARADTFGIIAAGARADVILLSADPRANIRAVERPRTVIVRGKVIR